MESLQVIALKKLAKEATLNLDACLDTEKRWLGLQKKFKHEPKQSKRGSDLILPIFFDNKGVEYQGQY